MNTEVELNPLVFYDSNVMKAFPRQDVGLIASSRILL